MKENNGCGLRDGASNGGTRNVEARLFELYVLHSRENPMPVHGKPYYLNTPKNRMPLIWPASKTGRPSNLEVFGLFSLRRPEDYELDDVSCQSKVVGPLQLYGDCTEITSFR